MWPAGVWRATTTSPSRTRKSRSSLWPSRMAILLPAIASRKLRSPAAAWAATGVMAKGGLIMRVSPRDPAVFVGITVLLLAIGLLACWLPARKASRITPTEALRLE